MHKLAVALTSMRSEAVAKLVAKWLRHARFGRHVVGYFETDAELAKVALSGLARGKSIAADEVRAIVEGHERAAKPDEGSMDDAPAMLRDPPWRRRAARPVLALETLPNPETMTWGEGEREKLLEMPAVQHGNAQIRPMSKEELIEFDALPDLQKYVDAWPRWQSKQWLVLEVPDERRLELWRKGTARLYQ